MKTLIILRHGKAEQLPGKNDFDRSLVERGRKNASQIGAFILQKQGAPDLILTSSAQRALETAIEVAETLHYETKSIQTDKELYFAPTMWILKTISSLSDEIARCLLVGHNPGLTDLINYLGVRLDNLPTASAVCFTFDVDKWSLISSKNASFQWFKPAKEC